MKLIINKPRIEGNRLISTIEYDNNKKYDLYFEVEEEYIKYLCLDNADSFFVCLLPFIVKNQYDVEIKACISSKLYYQVNSYLLPLLCKEFKKSTININTKLSNKVFDSKAVGASISCGVDSFYTLLKHQKCEDSNYNITHLTFFNAGSHGEYGGDAARKLYKERLKFVTEFCNNNNYKLVTVDSNMNELIMMNHQCRNTFTTLACVFALEKLFGIYYFASCFGFNGSRIDEFDTTYYDILNVHTLSNENITFYCDGIETTRLEKVKYISNYPITYNWLNVCVGSSANNCCRCPKCMRTITELESIGKLKKYKNVFDLDYFYNNRSKIYAHLLIENKNKVNHEFYQEILDECKINNIKIPFKSYIMSILPSKKNIKIVLKKILPKKLVLYLKQKRKKMTNNDGWTN